VAMMPYSHSEGEFSVLFDEWDSVAK
jgi:hypothetical protein